MSPATSRSLREAQPAELAELAPRPRARARLGLDVVPARRRARARRDRPRSASFASDAAEAQDFGRIVATGYGLPDAVVPWAAQAPSLGWDCWLALDGDEPAGCGRPLRLRGRRVPRLRRDAAGASGQGRPERAARGADRACARGWAATSSSPRPASAATTFPPNSYRNILRAGFTEVAVRANWLRPAPASA